MRFAWLWKLFGIESLEDAERDRDEWNRARSMAHSVKLDTLRHARAEEWKQRTDDRTEVLVSCVICGGFVPLRQCDETPEGYACVSH